MSPLNEHRRYLADGRRVAAYEQAIAEVVRRGDVVVDLGAGTGILGLLACRAGAARVYAIDDGPMIEIARMLGTANGYADRQRFVRALSTEAALAEPADVVLADQIGHFGIEAGIIQYFADARRHLLKPTGRLLPQQLELLLAPVEYPDADHLVGFWDGKCAGVDVSSIHPLAANTTYAADAAAVTLLAPPAQAASLALGREHDVVRIDVGLTVQRPGIFHGLIGCFSARLSPSVTMTNAPQAADRIDRSPLFFPILRPCPVKPGVPVHVGLTIRPAEVQFAWTVTVGRAASQRTFRHSTLQGGVIDPADLARTRPDHRPILSRRAEAERLVLSSCDGARTVSEIEAAAADQYPDLLRTPVEAAAFVAAVLARHAR